MKKRLLVALLTLCLALGSAFALVGCKDEDGVKQISAQEFTEGIIKSYDNLYASRKSYEEMAELTVHAKSNSQSSMSVDWEYTPEGNTTPEKVTYENKYVQTIDVIYSVKQINGDLFFTVTATTTIDEIEYDIYGNADNTKPLTPDIYKNKKVDVWTFGVDNGTYYVKRNLSIEEGEETLNSPTVSKTYKTYTDKDEYASSIMQMLDFVDADFLTNAYQIFGEDIFENPAILSLYKYTLEGEVYGIEANMTVPSFDFQNKNAGYTSVKSQVKYNNFGPQIIISEMKMVSGLFNMAVQSNIDFKYSSSITAETNALEGYVLDANLDIEDAKYEVGSF